MRPSVRYALLAAAACATAFFVLLIFAYGAGSFAHADAVALHGFTTLDVPSVHRFAGPAAQSVDIGPTVVILALLCAFGIAAGRGRQVAAAVAVVAAADVSSQVLKATLAHPRFDVALGSEQLNAAAFPSGHATAVMALAIAALLIAPRWLRPSVAVLAVAHVLAVCLSILILGWHTPSDVFGGMLLATGFGCVAVAVLRALELGPVESRQRSALRSQPRAVVGGVPDEWAAGALIAILGAVVGAVVAISRAGELVDYARAQTVSTAMAMIVAAIGACLLTGFTALVRE